MKSTLASIVIAALILSSVSYAHADIFCDVLLERTQLFDNIVSLPEMLFKKQLVGAIGKPDIAIVDRWYNDKINHLSKEPTSPAKQEMLDRIHAIKMGTWTQPNLGQLRQQAHQKLASQKNIHQGTLHLIVHDPKNPSVTDIRFLHTRYQGAFFMLASNFNALEGGMGDFRVGFDHMNKGPVQGEEAVMTTMGAGIFRRYFLPRINLLDGITDLLNIDTTYGTPLIIGLKNPAKKLTPTNMAGLTVGVHRDIAVTSQHNSDGKMVHRWGNYYIPAYNSQTPITGPDSVRVSHILTSAHDLRNVNAQSKEQQDIAREIIIASYEATLLAAVDAGAKELVLTMLGAGAFVNNPMWIVESLDRLIPVIIASGITTYIVVRHSNEATQKNVQRELKKLQKKIAEKIKQYEQKNDSLIDDLEKVIF